MVVLLPLFEGEELRSCSGCPHLGLISPVKSRTSFWRRRRRCRICTARRDLERKRRLTLKDPDFLRRKREAQERYAHTPRGRQAAKRARKRRVEKLGAEAIRQEQRLAYGLREEKLRGRPLPEVENSQYKYTGVLLEPAPFVAWLRDLVRYEEMDGWTDTARLRVAANLRMDESYLGKLLKGRKRPIDESVVDAAIARHGRAVIQEIYRPHHRVVVTGEGKVSSIIRMSDRYTFSEAALAEGPDRTDDEKSPSPSRASMVRVCKDPSCEEAANWSVHTEKKKVLGVIEDDGPFCRSHAERLARIRAELEGDGALMASCGGAPKALSRDRAKIPSRPTCCVPGCINERLMAERFCDSCQSAGWVEETCE